jgi:MFS transporter, ACS family, hexuronate transporter
LGTDPGPQASEWPLRPSAGWLIVVAATCAMSISYIDRQVLAVLATSVRGALSLSHEQFGWLASAFALAYLVGTPFAGLLMDRIGARRGLVLALLLWSAFSAFHALAGTFLALLLLRAALGLTESPTFPGAAQAVRRALASSRRAAGFGLLMTGGSIGATLAPPIVLGLKAHFGWRFAFVGTALLGLLWLPLWWFATTRPGAARALSAAESTDGSKRARLSELLRHPALLRSIVLALAFAPTAMFVLTWFPQYLQRAHGVPEDQLARYLWLPWVFYDAGAILFGIWASRRDARRKRQGLDPGSHHDLVVFCALLISMIALVPAVHAAWSALVLASLATAGCGGLYGRTSADVATKVGSGQVATAAGLLTTAQSIAAIVVNPLIGRIVDRTHSYVPVLIGLGVLIVPATLAWVLWPTPRPAETQS